MAVTVVIIVGGVAGMEFGYHGPVRTNDVSTVLELVDRQISASPDAPAVVHAGRTVSYRELSHLADRVSYRLRHDFQVTTGDAVMITMEAGIEFAAVALGSLRAGAGYLPVDLSYPAERLAYISQDSHAKVVVVPEATAERPDAVGADQLTAPIDADWIALEAPVLKPDDTSYMIFSSGSTGWPKGIVQTHRSLANVVSWQIGATGLGRRKRVLQAAPLSFDVSVQEMWYTLGSGGCLYVPEPQVKRDPRDLMRFIIDNEIEILDFPQSLIDAILTLPVTFADAPALRHIISAGETVRINPALKELLLRRPELTLHNHYGPAENHMVAAHSMSAGRDNLEPRPPVGSLVWNTYIYILDDVAQPVPDGEVGEVYIGGVGVGTGYTDADLTKAMFISDPFKPGARLYRTRDRGRWRPDQTLELLGRIDDLIKIRGYSVEPREVEEHLSRLAGVGANAVFGRERADGTVELHAVVVGHSPTVQELRRHLLELLPDYMVPARWWLVDRLPISPNGKMDRRALPGAGARPMALV